MALPYNDEAEAAVLGCILIDNSKLPKVLEILRPEDFYNNHYRYIFVAMESLYEKRVEVDLLTLSDHLRDAGLLDLIGGAAELTQLTSKVPTSVRVLNYAQIVADDAAKRRIKRAADQIGEASANGTSLEDTLKIVKEQIHEVNQIHGKQNKYQVSSMLDHIEEAQDRYKHRNEIQGLSTGFPSIDTLTMGLMEGELIVVAGPTSKGKGSRVSEIIPTPSGDRRFGDLKIGDYVFGSNGLPTMITGTFPLGTVPIYRVWFSDKSYLDTTREHLWVLQRKDRPDMIRTSEELMSKLPSKKYHVPTAKPLEYLDNSQPIDPYILGLYIADGHSSGSNCTITKSEGPVSDYIYTLSDKPSRYNKHTGYTPSHSFNVSSNLREYINISGLYGKRSKDKFIPQEWFTKTHDIRLRLIRGLMDGDGSYVLRRDNKHGTAMYHSTSEQLVDDMMRLVTSVGWIARKGVVKHKKGNYFRLTLHSTNFTNPFFMSNEAKKWSPLDKEVKRGVTKVEIIDSAEAMCISVDASDQLYVADTRFHIVTHNTLLAMSISNNIAKKGGRVLFVTLEMTKAEMTSRYMYVNGGSNTNDFYTVAANTVFQENDELDWKDIDGLIQNAKEQLDVDLVVIDHLHYFARDIKNAAEELGKITMTFKKNAIRHKLPIILISHIRKMQKDEDLSGETLRGSSLIAQDSDIVLLVNRDAETNQMGVLIDKNRNRGKLSDRTPDWAGRSQREIDTIYLDFNNTKLHDPMPAPSLLLEIFPGATVQQYKD